MDLNAQTDDIDTLPKSRQSQQILRQTRSVSCSCLRGESHHERFLRLFVWWFWRSKLLFSWVLPGIFTGPEEVVESMRAHNRAQTERLAEASSPTLTSLHSRLNMKLVSPLLSDASSGGFPAYESIHSRTDTVFESAMLFGQRDRSCI